MGRVAFVFSGQGDQYPGMGKELYENFDTAAKVFRMCESIRPGTMQQCFSGTAEELKETKNTQPCLFAMELAAFAVLEEKGIRPDAVAGFSLGEVVAVTAAGYFDYETGFRLVCARGELMQTEAEKQDTAMAAVVKLSAEKVEELCGNFPGIFPVNFNCPGQISVSGLAEQMPAFTAAVKAAGGRALPLKVKGAFHSPFMQAAAEGFGEEIRKYDIQKGNTTLYSNLTGQPYGEEVVSQLSRQISSPVLWETAIRNMIASGIDTFFEIGPGKTLTNMIRKISADVTAKPYTEYLSEVTTC